MTKQIKRIFGIDLGTTYSSIACVDEYGKPIVIPNAENQRVTPSVVFFDGENIVVGDVAKESSKLYPGDVVSFIKRSMGEANFAFEHNGKQYRPEEISSFIIRKIVQDAELNLGISGTKDVVITCPAYFGINEREATRRAGEIAGYNVRQIINEPTAAAIAFGSMEAEHEQVVLVYDLGGGTFDITMIDIKPNASIEVICTGGDHNLGGKDWDDRIVAYMVQEFQKATGIKDDILADPDTCQDLQLSAEKAKKILTQRDQTPVLVTHAGERIKIILERRSFEIITEDLLERTISLTHEMLEEAGKRDMSILMRFFLWEAPPVCPRWLSGSAKSFPWKAKSLIRMSLWQKELPYTDGNFFSGMKSMKRLRKRPAGISKNWQNSAKWNSMRFSQRLRILWLMIPDIRLPIYGVQISES